MRSSPSNLREPLRIGLLLDSFLQPRWVVRIIEEVAASEVASIVLVVRNNAPLEERGHIARRLWSRRNHLLYAAYTKFDERVSRVSSDAFEKQSLQEVLTGVPVLEVLPLMHKFTDRLQDNDVRRIRDYKLDVALRFGFRILKGEALHIARYGVWSYHHDDGRIYRGGPPGFWEVMTGDPVTGSMLQILNEELDNGQVIYRSWSPTVNQFSVKKNNNNYYWKTSAFVMRKLKELYETGKVLPECGDNRSAVQPYSHRLFKTPVNREMFGLALGLGRRAFVRSFEKLIAEDRWSLAYRFRADPADPNNAFYRYKYLLPPKEKFWADPFPVEDDGSHFIFFEEFDYHRNKAHISMIRLNKGEAPSLPLKVLERPYHLSYPFIFEWHGERFMIPETGGNNTVELYRCRRFPDEWEFDRVLLEARNPTDATLVEHDGRWWMFVNIEEPNVTVNWEELHLFYADSPLGPWLPHRRNPVKSDVRNSRPAGRLFTRDNTLFRPAQDCSRRYGYATVINRVLRLTPDEFCEQEVSRITPQWDRSVIGTHTINTEGDLTVIDCLVRRNRLSAGRGLVFTSKKGVERLAARENVLQFIHSFIQGGSERQMIQLTRLLMESGRYRVHVACLHDGGALRPELEQLGFKNVAEFPLTSFYDGTMAVQLRRFSAYLKQNDIRLVHTHDFYSNIFGMAGAALAGVPARVASRRETTGMRTPTQKKAERLAYRLAHEVVTNAEAVKRSLAEEGISEQKIAVVYNGLDLERLKPKLTSRSEIIELLKLPVTGEEKFVSIVANLQHDVKDHFMFLRAAKRIHAAMPETRFLLAGEGRLLEPTRAYAEELGIGDYCFFLGRCLHVPEVLRLSDVCVLSSKAEGFSNAILEYMAAGRAVVATDVGGAREAIEEGKTGFLVPAGDHEAMAERVITLLSDPDRTVAMGELARQTVEDQFSCAAQLRSTETLYERLLQRQRR